MCRTIGFIYIYIYIYIYITNCFVLSTNLVTFFYTMVIEDNGEKSLNEIEEEDRASLVKLQA